MYKYVHGRICTECNWAYLRIPMGSQATFRHFQLSPVAILGCVVFRRPGVAMLKSAHRDVSHWLEKSKAGSLGRCACCGGHRWSSMW